ncbi:MAG: sugar phosphate isomerase/epimerase [bacterium]
MASKITAQLYTIRDFVQTEESFAASMKKLQAIGFENVQVSGIGPINWAIVASILKSEGLKPVITHIGLNQLQDDIDEVIVRHQTLGCVNVAIGSIPGDYQNYEGYLKFAEEGTEIGKKLAAVGMTFSYHNHSFEFQKFNGKTGLALIYENSDPKYLQAEIDTYWIQHGGGDPADWIRKMKNRMPVVHFKDMLVYSDGPGMAEIGEGNLNWPRIIDACVESNVEYYAIEQDVCRRDPFESLKISFDNLKKMGVE